MAGITHADDTRPTPPGHRLFFAIEITQEVRDSLTTGLDGFRKGLQFTPVRIDWAPPENFHITLYFLGNISVAKSRRLAELLPEAAAPVPPFDLDVRHLGVFPPPEEHQPPKVLWAGCHNPPTALTQLRANCASIMARAGVPIPDQNFTPHVTLARFRSARGLDAFKAQMHPFRFLKAGISPVTRLVLMESITGGGPARYQPFATAPLGAAAAGA